MLDSKLRQLLLVVAFMLVAIVGLTYIARAFPQKYPDATLHIAQRTENVLDRITLPLKLARLSRQEPDTHILIPVYGARVSEITDTWLAPRGVDRLHEGQDIFEPKGTPILSGTYGYVVNIADTNIGGKVVYIKGAGGVVYYYAHLDDWAQGLHVGQEVHNDTLIGYMGNTGNAITTPPHLHFGVYESGQAIDPLPRLIDR